MKKHNSLKIEDEAMLLLEFSGNNIVINIEDNHYKFWTYSISCDGTLTTYWGRIGKNIHKLEKKMDSEYKAKLEGLTLIRSKINKGYKPLNFNPNQLFHSY